MDPNKMSTEQLQKMLAELQGLQKATAEVKPEEVKTESLSSIVSGANAEEGIDTSNKAELKAH